MYCLLETVKGSQEIINGDDGDRTAYGSGHYANPLSAQSRSLSAEWTRDDLAAKSGVFANTIKNFENGISDPKRSTMLKWKRALEQAGIEFLDPTDDGKGEGVRFKSSRGKR